MYMDVYDDNIVYVCSDLLLIELNGLSHYTCAYTSILLYWVMQTIVFQLFSKPCKVCDAAFKNFRIAFQLFRLIII